MRTIAATRRGRGLGGSKFCLWEGLRKGTIKSHAIDPVRHAREEREERERELAGGSRTASLFLVWGSLGCVELGLCSPISVLSEWTSSYKNDGPLYRVPLQFATREALLCGQAPGNISQCILLTSHDVAVQASRANSLMPAFGLHDRC